MLRDFRQALDHLRTRRGMYIADGFDTLVAFLVGYSEATKRSVGMDLMGALQEYTKEVYGKEFAVIWPYYLLNEEAAGDEQEGTRLVFSTVDGFASKTGQENL